MPYQDAHVDSVALLQLLGGILIELRSPSASITYEAGLLYVVARNLSIIGSWRTDKLCFSVSAPFRLGAHLGVTFPLGWEDYLQLRASRKLAMRGEDPPLIPRRRLVRWTVAVETWLRDLHLFDEEMGYV
jgi:hypothetical protein